MALPTKKIRLVIPDEKTRDEITYSFDTLDQALEFLTGEIKKKHAKRIEVTEAPK